MTGVSADLAAWCVEHLGAPPRDVLFERRQVSRVTGLRLADGRAVVVKVRPAAARVATCVLVQKLLRQRGFPCPDPLAGPAPLGSAVATAEAYVGGGEPLAGPEVSVPYAEALARLVGLVSPDEVTGTLEPVPYWMHWDHEGDATWPPDPSVDLNAVAGPDWLERAGRVARDRLRAARSLPVAIGHGDWESQNLRWRGRVLHVAHDWDSVVRRPAALIAGMSSLMFPSTGTRNEAASVDESEAFLAAYQSARRRPFTRDETEVAWAAGLWIGAWKAKKALLFGDRRVADELAPRVAERTRRTAC